MSLLLEALQRSESLARSDTAIPPLTTDPVLSASAGVATPAPLNPQQQAAQTLVQASGDGGKEEAQRQRRRRLWGGLLAVSLPLLGAGVWFAWTEGAHLLQPPSGIVPRQAVSSGAVTEPAASVPSPPVVASSDIKAEDAVVAVAVTSESPETAGSAEPGPPPSSTPPPTIAPPNTPNTPKAVKATVWPPEAKVPPSSAPAPRNGPPHAAPAAPAVDRPVVLAASPVLSGAQLPVHADALPKPAAAASHSASAASAAPPRGRAAAAAAPTAAPATDVALVRSQVAQQVQQAWSSLQRGELVQAEGVYRQVLSDKPDDPDAALGLAVALHRQKKWEDAWNAYQRSMQLWPDNPMAQTGMLAILSETDASTAVSRLQEWVATRPRDAAAHAALARLWAKQSKWAEALPLLQRAYTLEPHQVSHVVNLAVALDQLRRYPEAIAHYRMALQTGVSGVPLTTIQARLDQLEASSSP